MAITGTGTQGDPYMVDSVAGLLQKVQESGVYIKITKDLDCYEEDTPWQSVKWCSKYVDGQKHSIDNIYVYSECIVFDCQDGSIANITFNITCDGLSRHVCLFRLSSTMGNSINSCNINLTMENMVDNITIFDAWRDWYGFYNSKIKVILKGKNATLRILSIHNRYGYIRNSEFLVYAYDNEASIDEINMIYGAGSEIYVEKCRFKVNVPVCKRFHIFERYSEGCQISSSYFIGDIGTNEALFNGTRGYSIVNSYIALKNHESSVNISTNSPTDNRTTVYNAINTFVDTEDTNIVPIGSFIGLTKAQCKDKDYLNSIGWYVK